jgi:DNA-binding response OmpR family regulator
MGKTILFIEDRHNIMENLSEYFELEGYEVFTTDNVQAATDIILEFIPDLIVCDMLLPAKNGSGLLKTLLQAGEKNGIPFVFSSSPAEPMDESEILELGADGYLIKPYEPEALLQMVRNLLRRTEQQAGQ